jgi:hypothetical protein
VAVVEPDDLAGAVELDIESGLLQRQFQLRAVYPRASRS